MSKDRVLMLNNLINDNFCKETFELLSEQSLMKDYRNTKSVNINIQKLKIVLKNNDIDIEKSDKIISEYISSLIPPGTKGVIKGNKFNNIVKEKIISYEFNKDIYDIQFEKSCDSFKTIEIPDWFIHNKITNKIIIGMNQLDLWGGGQQLNRGFKYLIDYKLPENVSIICVVCNHTELKSSKSKCFTLFDTCLEKGTLTYIKNLKNNIEKYI